MLALCMAVCARPFEFSSIGSDRVPLHTRRWPWNAPSAHTPDWLAFQPEPFSLKIIAIDAFCGSRNATPNAGSSQAILVIERAYTFTICIGFYSLWRPLVYNMHFIAMVVEVGGQRGIP